MTAILLYLSGGLLLLVSLLLLCLEKGNKVEGAYEFQPAHDFWSAGGSAMHVAKQIFGEEDWEYVRELNSKVLERRFLKERKIVALTWVRAARTEARALMRVHRAASSTSPHLSLRVELRIAFAYIEFFFHCAILELVIQARGPVALQRFVAMADARSTRLYEVVGQVFPLVRQQEGEFNHATSGRKGLG